MDLILVRGVSGSGKSTFANTISDTVFSADDYFMKDGLYIFHKTLLSSAHADCVERTELEMKKGTEKVVVANTFTQDWEMSKYFSLGAQYKYRVFTIVVENRHGSDDVHNVPSDVKIMQKDRFEILL